MFAKPYVSWKGICYAYIVWNKWMLYKLLGRCSMPFYVTYAKYSMLYLHLIETVAEAEANSHNGGVSFPYVSSRLIYCCLCTDLLLPKCK